MVMNEIKYPPNIWYALGGRVLQFGEGDEI
jgi:hypothetical protein